MTNKPCLAAGGATRSPFVTLLLTAAIAGCATKGGSNTVPAQPGETSGGSTGGPSLVSTPSSGDASLSSNPAESPPVANAVPAFTGPLAGPFSDLPSDTVLDMPDGGATPVPSNAAQLFGPSSQGAATGGPCLLEPEVGSLYPNNWLRPRFAWNGANGANLFELRVHADNQTNDLVVYTTQTQWTMPKAMWDALRADSQDVPMTVSIRSGRFDGTKLSAEALGSNGPIGIAPVGAPGSIVYWAIVDYKGQSGMGGTGVLEGFSIGDESVVTVLTGPQVQQSAAPAGNRACIGCHAATPDGLGVGFQAEWLGPGGYNNSIATLGQDASPGGIPSFLTPAAGAELAMLAGAPTYSPGHWTQGDHVEILANTGDLTWVDLEGTGTNVSGVIARSLAAGAGDLHSATAPTWSRSGSTIVYTSVSTATGGSIVNGRPASGPMDLYSVPYNNKAGGNATPLAGASDPATNEYYPAFSPDDEYIAFVNLAGNSQTYNSGGDEMDIVPARGGTATRLDANDPPACSGATSPGVTNSWPRWSPSVQTVAALGNTTYYWIVFSSTRPNLTNGNYGPPQLYISPVTIDANGVVTTFHSLYLWNQSPTAENHLPAWDVFQIPPVPITSGPPR
jgi:hypothetical protein